MKAKIVKTAHTCENCQHTGTDVTEQPKGQGTGYFCTDYWKCTVLTIVCSWCKQRMGTKPGLGVSGVTSGCCPNCFNEHYGNAALQVMMIK